MNDQSFFFYRTGNIRCRRVKAFLLAGMYLPEPRCINVYDTVIFTYGTIDLYGYFRRIMVILREGSLHEGLQKKNVTQHFFEKRSQWATISSILRTGKLNFGRAYKLQSISTITSFESTRIKRL